MEINLSLAKNIKLLIVDIDGVMTDGGLYFGENGETIKRFHVLDGLGIRLLQKINITTAVITGRSSPMVSFRAKALGIKHIYQGSEDKMTPYDELLKSLELNESEVAVMGDDLPDLALMQRSAVGITVPNANEYLKSHADWITTRVGGNGAVREAAEYILKAQGQFEHIYQAYNWQKK